MILPPILTRQQIAALARAVHDEIYSIENTLKRRGYRYAGHGSARSLLFPTDLPPQKLDDFYRHMKSRTFRTILKSIVEDGTASRADWLTGCTDATLSKYLDFLISQGVITCEAPGDSYSLATHGAAFGPTLEWYIAELFKRELASTADWGVRIEKFKPGGDFDVMARVESELVWIEAKSVRPRDVKETHVRHFLQRDQSLDPDMSVFLVDSDDDLSVLVAKFEGVLGEARAGSVERLEDFGGVCHLLRRVFITNSDPSILTNLRHCLNYYFAVLKHSAYVFRDPRIDFLSKR